MKHINKILIAAGLMAGFFACNEMVPVTPNITKPGLTYPASFLFVNASPDAPALSFFVNGDKMGADRSSDTPGSYAQGAYTTINLTSPGYAGALTTNTAIRAKAASGSIGGILGSNDLIYRGSSTSVNNFVAISGNSYTVFVIDSLSRPSPLRTYNSGNFGDLTYYNPKGGAQIGVVEKAALTDATEISNLVTIGLVPLGSSDPGGVRFYLVQDAFVTFTAATALTNAGIRLVNAAPNTNGTPGGPSLSVRLRPAAGTTIALATGVTHVTNSAALNPSVGSRTVTTTPPAVAAATFTSQAIATAGVPTNYTLEASTNNYTTIAYSAAVSFTPGKNYTVFMRGIVGKAAPKGLSHGIVTHN